MTILTVLFTSIGLAMFGGLWNRLRGGGQESITYKPLQKLDHQTKRAIMALVMTSCYYLPLCIVLKIDLILNESNSLYFAAIFTSCFVFALSSGWGSWFYIGRAQDVWKHDANAFWVEWAAYLRYGKKWIPANWNLFISEKEYLTLKKRFNLMDSPTGEIRPFKWRRDMEYFAMCVRGLGITMPASSIFAAQLYFEHGIILWSLPLIWASGWLMGWCYEKMFYLDSSKWPRGLQMSTQLGEFLTGAIVMTGLPFLIISIQLLVL